MAPSVVTAHAARWAALVALVVSWAVVGLPSAARAAGPVLPGNEGDVGVYTDGEHHVMEIGDPVYTNVDEVAAKLAPGVPYTAASMHQSIFEQDLAAGGTDYHLDRVLGVRGTIGSAVLMTRGRSLYLRGASNNNFAVMGFAGNTFVGGPNNLGNLYTVTVPGQTVSEVTAERFNAPSHAKARYTVGGTGVTADLTKFITYDNVAVTAITFANPGAAPATFTVRAASPLATAAGAGPADLTGTRTITSGANNGLVDTAWNTVTIDLTAAGFTRTGTALDREVTVPAGGSVALSVVGAVSSPTLPASAASYAALSPADAVRTGVTAFNRRWAQDVPYIDVPDPALEKAIVYRWWGERYNSLDANAAGYAYQYPTTVEGANLYQNAVALTQPMHLQDTKWLRNPYLAYGQILNIGELSGSSAFLDSPGHTSWNNHYSQYIGTAGLEAYNVHGGGTELAAKFARYFEGDGVGQLEHYDGNGDDLIAYDTNFMPGNDADAITFGYPKANAGAPGARTIERPESAYVWGAFDAARQLYRIAGADQAKVDRMAAAADAVRAAVLDRLWSTDTRMFLAGTSHGATSAASSNGRANPLPPDARDLIPAKESNLYDVYAQNLVPFDQWPTYVDGFRFLTYGDNFPIFPFYTANQYDRAAYGIGGSNNFSNINFTVQYRGVRSALRHYDPTHKYLTPAYAKRLLDWMAWSIYPGADLRAPNQAEYYSNWNPTTRTYNRNNPNHVMLGNMNYIFVEDMGGLQPRSDDKIELWPIGFGYPHFMVNNVRYHGKDVTIVWDPDGSAYRLGAGYSLFLDGEKKVTTDRLGRLTYDPAANTVSAEDGLTVTFRAASGAAVPSAVDTAIDDPRVVDYLKTAGIDLTSSAPNLAASAGLSSSYTQQGARPAPWRQFHTPGFSTTSMNYAPGAIAATERPVSLAAVTDGVTANEPYWGNYGTTEKNGYVELDLGAARTVDNVKVTFVSDRQAGGYREPARWWVQVPDGAGGWKEVPDQFKNPTVPAAKFNEALFAGVDTRSLRVAFTNNPTFYTAIAEIQVFDSGRPVPPVSNQAPVVTATRDGSADGNLSTRLVGTASDDGVPYDSELTYGWETVSAPAGAGVIFADPAAPATRVTGTVAGDYVFRFFGDDGARRSVATVAVTLAPKAVVAEFGATATVTTSGTAPWENHSRVSERTNPTSSNPGAGNGWGNWGQQQNGTSVERAGWIQYAWTSPVRLSSADVYWYDDNGGTRRPNADTYAIETSADGTTWTPVTLVNGSSYAGGLATNAYNHFDFAPLDTRLLRIRIWGVQSGGAGTGVLRWRANGEAVDTVRSPVLVRTTVGEVPVLPGALDIGYASGARGTAGFQWQPITPAMVAETNVDPFVVYGTNDTYGLIAEARVYVRPETAPGGISIQGVESFTRSVAVGEQPYLPDKVEVSYNDGSRDNQAIGVRWRFDPDVVDTPGRYTVIGDLVLPPYVGDAGATRTTLTLTVGTDTVAPTTSIAWSPAGTGEWFTTVPSFTLTAQDAFGVEGTSYRVDDGDWTAYAGTPVAVAGEGSHQVTYRSVDVTGNVESPRTATVRVDTVAPAAAFSSAIGDVHEGSVPPAPTCTATDATSGPRGCVVSGYATAVGTHTVTATATDNAGNVGTATQTYRVLPRCTTTITGTRPGPLVVTAGLTCVERATVNGSVTVGPGASLMVRGGTIAGPLSATGAGTVTLAATTVGGPVSVAGSTGELRITGGRLAGAVSITRGTGGVRLDAVTIGGPVTLTGNTGTAPVVAAANTIGGPLACSGNTPPPTDEGRANTVRGPASGQCAKL